MSVVYDLFWDLFGFLYRSIRSSGFLDRRYHDRRYTGVDDRRYGSKWAEGRRLDDD